jgi:tetratricopeptide (TPR) repeat protein
MTKLILIIAAGLFLCACSNKGGNNPSGTNGSNTSGVSVTGGNDSKSRAQSLLDEGNHLYNNDRDEEAARAYEQAIQLDPSLGEAHYKLGLTYYITRNRDDAEKEFQAAVDAYEKYLPSHPDDGKAQYTMGLALNKLNKPEEAVKVLKQAVKNSPNESDYFYELGNTQNHLAQYQEAVAAFQKAIDLDPDNFRAQEAIVTAKENAQRKQAAEKRAEDQAKAAEKPKKIEVGKGLPPILKQQ